ncbi:MAG: NAD-glutamate dehydrogenase [Geminicoccaceae bacterium]
MPVRKEDRKAEILDRLHAMIRDKLEGLDADRAITFVDHFYRDVAPGDLFAREQLDLYGAALGQLRLADRRPAKTPLIRVFNPRMDQHGWQSTHTIVEIVNDDMPFLVDSITNELNRRGLGIHIIIHPLYQCTRDGDGRLTSLARHGDGNGPEGSIAESFMHIEIDRQSDQAFLDEVEKSIARVLGDVRLAVQDWRAMRSKISDAIAQLEPARKLMPEADFKEYTAFLEWLADDHFTLLGYSSYRIEGEGDDTQLRRIKGSGLGIFRGKDEGGLSASFRSMPVHARRRAHDPFPPVAVAKAHTRSTVHRSSYLDFIGVRTYAENGKVTGESRFLGLFTSAAYNRSPSFIPLLRRKIERITEKAAMGRTGHSGKALVNILETYPRDELFQIQEEELLRISTQILHLQDRQHIRLFVRRDQYERFVSCLVYVPRERYNTAVRLRFQAILERALDSDETDYQAQLSESVLARILFMVRTPNGIPESLDVEEIERQLADVAYSWSDKLKDALIEAEGEEEGNRLYRQFGHAFPGSYQESLNARAAVPDILAIDALSHSEAPDRALSMSLYRRIEDRSDILRFKLIRPDRSVFLADALPIMENMGLRVLYESPHRLTARGGQVFSIHDFGMEPTVNDDTVEIGAIREQFQDTFRLVWSGDLENDGFNRLVLAAGLAPRQIMVLRAYCKYFMQLGSPFSQAYIERTFTSNASLARGLAELFDARFDPDREGDRAAAIAEIEERIRAGLEHVAILDEDRIIRRYLGLINATLRTNAFQHADERGTAKPYLSLKFDPAKVPGMPLPKPAYEIFVYAPHVEGVHLRGGKVARGGLRWSDRREDFRTEVLGLMKAQMVKNSVIVPVGAKGGFVVKQPPAGGDRQAFQEEGIRCYRTFLSGLLDITDNRTPDGIKAPERVIRYDEDDPYLVVAADKGTATFSDIANGVSRDYGFWLDDAFASGGSAGYDHKGMGITAKGAWESVKRHFREMGIDTQSEPFTVVGIGDMSGDVFGNGMLLSEHIRLVAAFDHRHIFLDPDPDPATSFAERQRLFDVPRSSWDDYDRNLISRGGGIFPRSAKSVTLSPEICKALDIETGEMAPMELMNAILKAPVDLWWNGGIGTYVKGSGESHTDAQDRANDGLRIDGCELRARVVGEGGNLGITQRGRIEIATNGGRINTDFIDNSAGVDCSDHEVNIKILLGDVVASGDMTMKQRDVQLAEMTDEVGELCLRDNILQNLALSMTGARAAAMLDAQQRMMRKLERAGRLDRRIELLPTDGELAERRQTGTGLTRPEAAVLLAYGKTTLYADLLATGLPDREYFLVDIAKYFPRPLRRRFQERIAGHRLRREIVATWLANSIVNRGLDVFMSELEDETGAELEQIAMAYVVTRDSFALLPLWSDIETLGFDVPSDQQIAMLNEARDTLVRGTRWFVAQTVGRISLRETVARFRPSIAEIMENLDGLLARPQAIILNGTVAGYVEAGATPELARAVAGLPHLLAACDIVTVAQSPERVGGGDTLDVARVYFALDAQLNLTWLRSQIQRAPITSRWDRMALSALEDELAESLRQLTTAALAAGVSGEDTQASESEVDRWIGESLVSVDRYRALLEEIEAAERPDLAMLNVAVGVVGKLLPRTVMSKI